MSILRTLLATSSVLQASKFVCGLGQSRAVVTGLVWGHNWIFICKAVTTALQVCLQCTLQTVCENPRPARPLQDGDAILSNGLECPRRVKGPSLILTGRSSCTCSVGQCGDCNLTEANDSPHDRKMVKKTSYLGSLSSVLRAHSTDTAYAQDS